MVLERISEWFGGSRPVPAGGPRIMAYCTSTIGMGHFCRLLRILTGLKQRLPQASILLVTDARDTGQAAQAGVALLQMPRFRFRDQEQFKEDPELLAIGPAELIALRKELLLTAGRTFAPHLLIMDSNPHGKRDEVLPLLKTLRRRGTCRTVMLMRDIPAPPGESFKLAGAAKQILKHAAYYDRLLLAGDPAFFDAAQVYQWPAPVRAKAVQIGFVIPPQLQTGRREAFSHFSRLRADQPTVAVSFGGGWQVEHYAAPLIEGLARYREVSGRPAQMALALGPAASAEQYNTLHQQAERLGGVALERFTSYFPHLLAHADLAVLQAGSAPFQVLETDIPILLTHRPYKSREQEERARRLAQWPGVRLVECESVTAGDCAEWLEWGLTQERIQRQTHYRFDGVQRATEELLGLLQETNAEMASD